MVYKRFRIVVLARVLLLSGTLHLFFYLLFKPAITLYATIFILGVIVVYQIYSLILYVERTNRDLNRFLMTIKHEDFSQTFIGHGLGSSFDDLKEAFNAVIQKFHSTRAEKEEHFRYLQTVVQHVGIGLIAFRRDGKVELFNNAAKKLLRIPRLKDIKELAAYGDAFVEQLQALKSGQQILAKIDIGNQLLQLSIHAAEFRMREQGFTLVSLQDIHSELEEKELEAWQNLIRVLTHEIMNSITPISSLASTVNDLLDSNGKRSSKEEISEETQTDIRGALRTIQKRSEGLLHFVDAYRDLTRIPTPNYQIIQIIDLLDQVKRLMIPDLSEREIEFKYQVIPESLELTADPDLVEQILINILKNAIQALDSQPDARINLLSQIDLNGRVIISVTDNGPGITQDQIEKIFIPFFTTKENGSGVGLSLTREIMRLHKGAVSVKSKPHEQTVFTLRF
jgi:nitrogen fixation/metabolism regulation signal transduction histidine kinase